MKSCILYRSQNRQSEDSYTIVMRDSVVKYEF